MNIQLKTKQNKTKQKQKQTKIIKKKNTGTNIFFFKSIMDKFKKKNHN